MIGPMCEPMYRRKCCASLFSSSFIPKTWVQLYKGANDSDGTLTREVNEAKGGLMLAAGRVRSKKKTRKKKHGKIRPPPKTHHEIHSSPATATTSRRRAAKHVPRVSPYSPASVDPGFVEIGLVQLSQSVKRTNVTRTLTDTKTDRRTDRLIE